MKLGSTSKVIRILTSTILIATGVSMANTSHAQIRLSDVVTFGTDGSGNIVFDRWDTRPGGDFDNWIQGLPGGAFLNGPSDAQVQPNIALSPGTNSFRIYGSPGVDMPNFGINLFFNGSATPSISAFGPMLTNAVQNHSFGPNDASSTSGVSSTQTSGVHGAGTLSFVSGNLLITLTDFYLARPSVFNLDQGGNTSLGPDGVLDYVGGFTLVVTTNPTSSSQPLINVDFGSGGARGYSLKTGLAAIGQSASDFWNFYDRDASSTSGDWRTSGSITNLHLADGTTTTVGMTVSDAPGAWNDASSDPMYKTYDYPLDGGNNVVTFTNLPAGQYDVLAYSPDGNFEVSVGGTSYGVRTTQDNPVSSVPTWTEGVQYARFTNVTVAAGQSLTLTVRKGVGGYAILSGVQIIGDSTPPTILSVIPPDQYVNEGTTVAYTANAAGSPTLAYQWQHEGSDIPGATNATLTLSNVVYAQAGIYTVVVSNLAGMVSSNVTLRVNRAPIADASATDTLLISPNNTNAIAVLDGSRSSDPDDDALTYAWFHTGEATPFATTVVAMDTLPVGTNQLTLTVNDGMASGSQNFAIEVITTSQAVDRLTALVQTGSTNNTQALVASLEATLASIDRSQPQAAINQLEAFINKVQAQLEPDDPDLAAQLITDAQAIIDSLNGGSPAAATTVEISAITHDHGGKSQIKVKGPLGRVYVVETSTNMVDWVPVGVATKTTNGDYDFDDAQSQETGSRFYRVVSPK